MIKLTRILVVITLFSCVNGKTENNSNLFSMVSLSKTDLELLKGINIGVRSKEEVPDRFFVEQAQVNYHLPVYNDKGQERIMNPKWYDVVKYAKAKGIDSSSAYEYVKLYSDSVLAVYNKAGALTIRNDPKLGDFIIFEVASDESYIYRFSGGKIKNTYWSSFFAKTVTIKGNWYIYKKER